MKHISKYLPALIVLTLFVGVFLYSFLIQKPREVKPGQGILQGDANNDGRVDILDFQLLSNSFGKSQGQTGYNQNADFNSDTRIDILDFQILSNNFGRTGTTPTPTSPIGPTPTNPPVNFLPAFPGAEGFGAKSVGGRGGTVIRVTNLNSSGSGSLRACVEASGPRTCVFDISGTINLNGSRLSLSNPFITIAGQTAPSPGITIRSGTVQIKTHDVIIQHIRFRYGDSPCVQDDALQFHTNATYNVIADHISVSWGVDENLNTYQNPRDVTVSNAIVSEALSNSCHSEGEHSKGLLIQDPTTRFSLIKSLFMHNFDRHPYIKDLTSSVIVNNVFYNRSWEKAWATKLGSGDGGTLTSSVVGNVYIEGDGSGGQEAIAIDSNMSNESKFYLHDNLAINMIPLNNRKGSVVIASSPPVWPELIVPMSASGVENYIKDKAGARPNDRDAVDTRLIGELTSRTGRLIDSVSQVGGWPNLSANTRVFPIPANPSTDSDGDGYTNLEEVLHQYSDQLEN